MDPISEMHAAIEPLLRPYFAKGRWAIEPVPFPLSLKEFLRLANSTPFIGISWKEFQTDANAGRALKGIHRLQITMVVKNAEGRPARFFGDRLGPGLYPSLATAAGVLHGHTIDGTGTLEVTRAGQSYADGWGDLGGSVGLIELSCRELLCPMLSEVEAAPDFARLVSDFEMQPPVDGRDPVTDTIDVPGASAP